MDFSFDFSKPEIKGPIIIYRLGETEDFRLKTVKFSLSPLICYFIEVSPSLLLINFVIPPHCLSTHINLLTLKFSAFNGQMKIIIRTMHYADLQVTEVAAMVLSLDQGFPDT